MIYHKIFFFKSQELWQKEIYKDGIHKRSIMKKSLITTKMKNIIVEKITLIKIIIQPYTKKRFQKEVIIQNLKLFQVKSKRKRRPLFEDIDINMRIKNKAKDRLYLFPNNQFRLVLKHRLLHLRFLIKYKNKIIHNNNLVQQEKNLKSLQLKTLIIQLLNKIANKMKLGYNSSNKKKSNNKILFCSLKRNLIIIIKMICN